MNFTAGCPAPRRVDVVVNGLALDLVLAESVLGEQVSALHDTGSVEFNACANTMAAHGVQPIDLHPAAHIVTAAVLHLSKHLLC
ncbi:MAG: DsrE family protein [Mycobacterium sp.]